MSNLGILETVRLAIDLGNALNANARIQYIIGNKVLEDLNDDELKQILDCLLGPILIFIVREIDMNIIKFSISFICCLIKFNFTFERSHPLKVEKSEYSHKKKT